MYTHICIYIYVWDKPEKNLREKVGEVLFEPLAFSSPFLILKPVTKIPYLLLVMWNFNEINLILTTLAENLKIPKFYSLSIERCYI